MWSMRRSGSMDLEGSIIHAVESIPDANLATSSGMALMIAERYSFSDMVTPTADSSLCLTRICPRNLWTLPPSGQHISMKAVSRSASAYWLFTLNSLETFCQQSLTDV